MIVSNAKTSRAGVGYNNHMITGNKYLLRLLQTKNEIIIDILCT